MSAEASGDSSSHHKGVSCDVCFKAELQGKRYKCAECFDYDMCESCFAIGKCSKSHRSSHPMLCILTKKDYEAKKEYLNMLVNALSYVSCEETFFDFPEVSLDRKSVELNLPMLSRPEPISVQTQTEFENSSNQESNEKGAQKLSQDLEQLFQDGIGFDITFEVGGRVLRAHKALLMARSPTFSKMFLHETAEAKSNTVVITDFEPETFQTFLAYLYSAKVDDSLLRRQATDLYGLADKYFVEELEDLCRECMRTNINVDNFCDVLYLATKHCDLDLLYSANEFFTKNLKSIIRTQKWREFNRDNPDEANELLIAALKVDG